VRQDAFERTNEADWRRFEALLDALDAGRRAGPEFPALYRRVCQHLALARDRHFGSALVERLNALALRGHQRLYGARVAHARPLAYLVHRFPRTVRREARLFAVASLLLYGAMATLFVLGLRDPDLVYSVVAPEHVVMFEEMYDPQAPHYGAPRSTESRLEAFGHYVDNNMSIAFRTFAGGILFGVGSLAIVLLNGVFFGALMAHLVNAGFAGTFFPFVIGHGSFELTAIVLSALAGLRLGLALLAGGATSRATALRQAAAGVVPILFGMSAMLLVAAIIEAFWSASPALPASVKLGVGAGLWVLVFAWLGLGGRHLAD
jgi:uncharacterized membrane protein SpoIIM required for sporulation